MTIKATNLEIQAINEMWAKLMGEHGIRCDIKFSDLIAYTLSDPMSGAQTTSIGNVVWVDKSIGSDDNDGSNSSPFKTLGRACQEIPTLINDDSLVIKVKAGDYSSENIEIITSVVAGKSLTIQGVDFVTSTLAGGDTSGSWSSVLNATATHTGAGWTVNDLANRWVKMTSGARNGQYLPILSNTADTVTLDATYSGINGESFVIVNSQVVVANSSPFTVSSAGGTGTITINQMACVNGTAFSLTEAGGSILNGAANVGSGQGVFSAKVGSDLQFKSLKASGAVSISADADSITYSSAAEANTASNVGTGTGVFAQKSGVDLQFKSLKASGSVSISSDSDSVTISGVDTGEANTASNLGASGEGLFAQKSSLDLQFKKLKGGTNVSLSSDAESVTVSVPSGFSKLFLVSAPAAASATAVHAAVDSDASNTFPGPITNPDVPRNISCTFAAGYDGGDITVVGTDQFDAAVTEVIADVAGTTVNGTKIFKTVTSITKELVGAGGGKTVSIGVGDKLGVVGNLVGDFGVCVVQNPSVSEVLCEVSVDNTYEAFTPSTVPNGTLNFKFLGNI